ncbi:MAG: valine--tRNA ligase, partial [Caulobacteraceae bacterium]|nr:valine--tRNA ligase [Caulobacter sp.]
HREGLLYRDKRLVNWDPALQTAISDLEVEQREVDGSYWRFAYPLEDGSGEVVVATTRPETMLGDTAVAVHPGDERYAALVGKRVRLPIVGRLIPIMADEYADPEKGSGAVKITPAHDFNDFQVGKRHGLEAINILDKEGRIKRSSLDDFEFERGAPAPGGAVYANESLTSRPVVNDIPEELRGLDRFAARKAVVARAEEEGWLRGIDPTRHAVPYGDRSGVVIEPYLTDQWYVDAATLAKPAIAAVEDGRTEFEPANWSKTYFEWMRNIEPWCVSRQLWWGHRIPAWYGPEGSVFVAEDEAAAHAAAREQFGRDVELRQDEDVLDTWFSSALWPFSTLGWPKETEDLRRFYPTATLVTGFDIIFFWVARMMMMGLHFMDDVPFRRVVMHGLVRDEKGAKMSKSKGNVIDPLEIVDALGADALRFSLAILSGTRDIKLSKSRIEGYRNFGTKLWNAARFCQMNGCARVAGFDPAGVEQPVNRWLRGEVVKAAAEVTAALDAAKFDEAAQALYRFIWNVLCDWYLEFAKSLLNGEDVAARDETRATAAWALDQALKLLHPVSPFITEELWAQTAGAAPRDSLLITAPWPDLPAAWVDAEADGALALAIRAVEEGRSLRSELNVPPSAKPPLVVVEAEPRARAALEANAGLIASTLRVSELRFGPAPQGSVPFVIEGAALALPVADVIDVAAERARLGKEVGALEGEAQRNEKKLANADFVARAKPEVVEETRARLAEVHASRERLQAALRRLEAVG